MKCGQCEAFAPNFFDEAHTSGVKYKCVMCGHMVLATDDACHLFNIDPAQKEARYEDHG